MAYQLIHPTLDMMPDYFTFRAQQDPDIPLQRFRTRYQTGDTSLETCWVLIAGATLWAAFATGSSPPHLAKRFSILRTRDDIPDVAVAALLDHLHAYAKTLEQPLVVVYNRSSARDLGPLADARGWRLEHHGATYHTPLCDRDDLAPDPAALPFAVDDLLSAWFVAFYTPIHQHDPFKDEGEPEESLRSLHQHLTHNEDAQGYLLTDAAGQPVAAGTISRSHGDALVTVLGVVPQVRRQGWGRRLHRQLMWAARDRADVYRGGTDMANVAMRRIFEQNGCVLHDEQWHITPLP